MSASDSHPNPRGCSPERCKSKEGIPRQFRANRRLITPWGEGKSWKDVRITMTNSLISLVRYDCVGMSVAFEKSAPPALGNYDSGTQSAGQHSARIGGRLSISLYPAAAVEKTQRSSRKATVLGTETSGVSAQTTIAHHRAADGSGTLSRSRST